MLPYMTCFYGNPHSRTHAYGWESEAATEKARQVGWCLQLENVICMVITHVFVQWRLV